MAIAVFCSCGSVVPAYFYCHKCRQVHGAPNCPCGKPIFPVKVWECATCNPSDAEAIKAQIIREYEAHGGRSCSSGDCVIPACKSCGKAERAVVVCPVCHTLECSRCSDVCVKSEQTPKSKRVDSTVTYSGAGPKYKKGADKDRPKMFVESWTYKGGKIVNRTLVGFEKKEG